MLREREDTESPLSGLTYGSFFVWHGVAVLCLALSVTMFIPTYKLYMLETEGIFEFPMVIDGGDSQISSVLSWLSHIPWCIRERSLAYPLAACILKFAPYLAILCAAVLAMRIGWDRRFGVLDRVLCLLIAVCAASWATTLLMRYEVPAYLYGSYKGKILSWIRLGSGLCLVMTYVLVRIDRGWIRARMGVFTATFLFLVYLLNFGLFRLSSITWFIFMPIAATAVLLSAILLVVPIGSIDPRVRRILVFSAIFIAYVCVAAVVFHGVKYRDEAQKDGAILLAWAITAFHFLTHYRFWYRDTERFVAMDKWVRAFSYFYTIFYTLGLLLSLTLFGFQPD